MVLDVVEPDEPSPEVNHHNEHDPIDLDNCVQECFIEVVNQPQLLAEFRDQIKHKIMDKVVQKGFNMNDPEIIRKIKVLVDDVPFDLTNATRIRNETNGIRNNLNNVGRRVEMVEQSFNQMFDRMFNRIFGQ